MSSTETTVTFGWTSPVPGPATGYDLRHARFVPTADNWAVAEDVAGEPAPSPAGSPETMTVTGIERGRTYFFAVRALDGPSPGPVSNVVRHRYTGEGRVVFVKEANAVDRWELFSTRLDGTGEVNLSGPLVDRGRVHAFQVSPDLAWVAFLAWKDTQDVYELYVVPAAGGPTVKVSGPPVSGARVTFRFYWSPDSTHVAYVLRQDAPLYTSLWVSIRTGSSNVKVSGTLLAEAEGSGPPVKWAPDGSRVAFKAREQGRNFAVSEIWSAARDGAGLARVSQAMPDGRNCDFFEWAPDSSRVGFSSDAVTFNEQHLYTARPDGTGLAQISRERRTKNLVMFLRWSPDSRHAAYVADEDRAAGLSDLYVTSPDGTRHTRATQGTPGRTFWPLEWSPDGAVVAYAGDRLTPGRTEICASFPDGSGTYRLSDPGLSDASPSPFAWAPDGGRVAYLTFRSGVGYQELRTASPDGTGHAIVSGPLVDGGQIEGFAWSPDGTRLGYISDQDTLGVPELYCGPADGSSWLKVSGPFVPEGYLNTFDWSADSSRLVYLARQDDRFRSDLYAGRVDEVQSQILLSGPLTSGGRASSFLADEGTAN